MPIERPGSFDYQKYAEDEPENQRDIRNVFRRPLTPAASNALKEKGVYLREHPELRLRLIALVESLGHQITTKDLSNSQQLIQDVLQEERTQAELIAGLTDGLHTDVVRDIEVLHIPNVEGKHANLRIRGITQKGYRVGIKNITEGLDGMANLDKIEMAKAYFDSLKGQEIQFYKQRITIYDEDEEGYLKPRGHRIYLRANPRKLPKNILQTDYRTLKTWYKRHAPA